MGLASIIYLLSNGLNGYLFFLLWRKSAYKEFPAFFAYVTFNCFITLLLFGTFSHPQLYRSIFIWGEVIVWILKGLVVGQVMRSVYGFRLAPQFARVSGFLPAYSLLGLNFPLERALGLGMAAIMAVLSFSKKDIPAKPFWIIVGLGGYHALSGLSAVELAVWPTILAFVPTFAYTAALILWIRAFRLPDHA